MPTYEYECDSCGHRFEVFQRISEDPIKACEKCGAAVHKVLFPVGIVFRGSGFHVNDYPSKSKAKGAETSSSSEVSKSTSD